jgi:hypothetical protein
MEKPMAPDERDRSFDKALSRHLRSAASPGVSANLPSGPAAQSGPCLDSETLAAYHERSLLPQEMNSWKEHVVCCARCQAILAQLEATDSLPLQAAVREKAPAMEAAKVVAVARKDQHSALAVLSEKSRASRFPTGVRWRWLAPAGALAAGLLVWVAWHQEKPPQLSRPSEVKIAKVQEPATPSPPAARQAPAAPSSDQLASDQFADLSKARGAIRGMESSKVLHESGGLKQQGRFDSGTRGTPAKPSPEKENALRKDSDRYSSPGLLRDENRLALDAKDAEAATTEKLETQSQAANMQSQNQMISPKVPGPAPLSQTEQSKKTKSDSAAHNFRLAPPAAPQAPAPVAGFAGAATTQVAAFSNPHLIAAPGTNALWRAGHTGMIEFSTDHGTSWSRQTSNVLADLTSGSAPSDKVCWIVGRAGTILLTTDAGSHWVFIHSPFDEDLGGVRAVDALHATIWNLRNTKTFETADGGATWKPVPNP